MRDMLTLQQTMDAIVKPETFAKIKMPVFMAYYYKDEDNQDDEDENDSGMDDSERESRKRAKERVRA